MMSPLEIGARLKLERERLGMTQTAFAARAKAGPGVMLKWEKGQSHPTARALRAFAEAGADVLFIVTGERREGASAHSSPTIADVMRAIVALLPPAERLELLLDLVAEARRA